MCTVKLSGLEPISKPHSGFRRRSGFGDGLFLAAIVLAASAAAFGQTSAFMLEQGGNPNGPPPPLGTTTILADPGETLTISVYLRDSASLDQFNGYQLIIPWNATGGSSGTISYNNLPPFVFPADPGGNSVQVDKANPDWIFEGNFVAGFQPVSYNETANSIFGAIYNYIFGQGIPIGPGSDVPHPGAANYLMQFQMVISPDACGTFILPFNIPPANPPLAAIFNGFGAAYGGTDAVTFQPLQIIIGPQNDACADVEDLGDGQIASVNFDTACASPDGAAAGCDGGAADLWYSYTTPVPCQNDLNINITAGEGTVTVYNAGASCTPGTVDELSCGGGNGLDPGVAAGDTYLIRVSGADAQGTLQVACTGCTADADCDDNNPCTSDNCTKEVCSNTPQALPCSDGNVCTLGDVCAGGSCVPGPVNDCDDFNPCTLDSCDAQAGGDGCVSADVSGEPCSSDDECGNGTCAGGSCVCQATANSNPPNSLRLDLRGCDNGPTALAGPCSSEDSACAPSPDGGLQCSDNNTNPLDGGICVDQCCYAPGGSVVVDLELGPMPDGACGGQFFLNYDPDCLTFVNLAVDPDDELGFDFVLAASKNPVTGNLDLVVSFPPGVPCDEAHAKFLGGTLARLTFTASDACKCGGVNFRPNNPAIKVGGPKGDIVLSELTGTDEIQIQGDPVITCPPDSAAHSDCGSIFRNVTYGPVTVSDECEEVTADITALCQVEFRKACQNDLDCGRGAICGPATDCGPSSTCVVDPLVDGAGFMCDGVKCTGYCTIDTCAAGVCATARDPQTIELEEFLDCSDDCQLPPGEVTIVCSYTNGCGRAASCDSSHYNSGLNKLCVDLEMSPTMSPGNPNDPTKRCIDLEIGECDAAELPVCNPPYGDGTEFCSPLNQFACGGHPEACFAPAASNLIQVSREFVIGLPENLPGHGSACVEVPPGNWTCLTVTDPKHSLTANCAVECSEDNVLYAEFKGSQDTHASCHWLVQGNLDGDHNIDIADYTIMAGQYLRNYGTSDTPCKDEDAPGHNFNADFNGDGLVTLADWTFVIFNFFRASKDPCNVACAGAGAAAVDFRRSKPRASMTRAELERAGLGAYVEDADANGDGVVNLGDMRLFFETLDDGGAGTAVIADLREAARKIELAHRSRELLPRSKRGQ